MASNTYVAIFYSSICYSYTVLAGIQNVSIYFTAESGIFSNGEGGGEERVQYSDYNFTASKRKGPSKTKGNGILSRTH